MQIQLTGAEVRSWQLDDAASLAAHANNRRIWRNLRDAFPHPYTLADARTFLEVTRQQVPECRFAIAVAGQAVGGIGIMLHSDVERVSAEIGYWLGEAYWGRGIITEAVRAVTDHAIRTHHLTRVYAVPFEWNPASFRVLEKSGYTLEAHLRRSAMKDGQVIGQRLYARIVPETPAAG
jgi:RimJ/RimL family protein N-acetyltransferase